MAERCAFEETFSFSLLPSKKPSFLQDRDTLQLLMKWSMLGRLWAQAFSFDQTFRSYDCNKFALCFFQDPNVVASLKKPEGQTWVPLDRPVVSVDVEAVPCTKVSMELFDPLCSGGGALRLRRPSEHMLEEEEEEEEEGGAGDEEDCSLVSKEERAEFLFRLFKHLWIGGELCQYDNSPDPYIDTVKKIYKDLISVQKHPETKKINVVSTVLKVTAYDECGLCYPGRREDGQTFAYLIVDAFKRHVTLFYHFYGIGNFTF